jgi:glycosyltransferase involved in cell wall biosynthesis
MSESKMKIAVLGTRGFPNVQGGVEVHCEGLYTRLVKLGYEVTVFARAPYLKKEKNGDSPIQQGKRHVGTVPILFNGVKIIPLPCPQNKFLEAFVHTFTGVFAAKKIKPDILHIHAIGPSLMVPLARFLGMKVVITHHGPDYERKKWGMLAKVVLKAGEAFGVRFANAVICISQAIADGIKRKYGRDAVVIPNGVVIPKALTSEDALRRFGLQKGKYVLAVGRFVPEKGFGELIDAFSKMGTVPSNGKNDALVQSPFSRNDGAGYTEQWKLVIVGQADHEDEYSKALKAKAAKNPNIILTGFLSGVPLQELYSHAGLFILPSYYEGLPIVLLEAMSYGLSCVVSDIPANREVALNDDRYFKPGDVAAISSKISEFIAKPFSEDDSRREIEAVRERYDWDAIAEKTAGVYVLLAGS